MRTVRYILLLLALCVVACANAQGVKWVKDFSKAQAQAKKAKMPILVDFYADW